MLRGVGARQQNTHWPMKAPKRAWVLGSGQKVLFSIADASEKESPREFDNPNTSSLLCLLQSSAISESQSSMTDSKFKNLSLRRRNTFLMSEDSSKVDIWVVLSRAL